MPRPSDLRACGEVPVNDLREYLERERIEATLIDLGTAMPTVQAAADRLGVPPGRIIKSLVLIDPDGRALVAVLAGDRRLDRQALADLAGCRRLKFAPAEVVLRETGYPAGGTPPVGHRCALPVFVDDKLPADECGYAGGGRHELLLKIRPREIVRAAGATVAAISVT